VVAAPVQLSNAHANRYTVVDREAAYQVWRLSGGRSLRQTAELTRVSLGTLGNWSKGDGWQDRARREDAEAAQSLRGALRAAMTEHALRSIATAAELRDDASGRTPPKVRLDASIWLAGIAGIAPVKATVDLSPAADLYDAGDPIDETPLSLQELQRRQLDRLNAHRRS